MPTWLLKTEPSTYSFADLLREKKAVWDGVTNPLALKHVRSVRKGDTLLIYHTGEEKRIVGIAKATSDGHSATRTGHTNLAVFELAPLRPLGKPVPLSAIKSDARFLEWELLRLGRLSVVPVPPAVEAALMELAGEIGGRDYKTVIRP